MLLQATELKGGYGKLPVIHGIDFKLEEGGVVAVLGPNGAGKSTLMKLLSRVLPVMSGELLYDGQSISGWSGAEANRAGLAYVPQEHNVFPELTVRENLTIATSAHAGAESRIEDVFEHFPVLEERAAQRAGTLSGGERQMLAVSSALLARPRVLLLDEPTAGLGPIMVERISQWIGDIAREGVSLVWVVEQNPEVVLSMATRVYVLTGGQVRWEGSPSAVTEEDLMAMFLKQAESTDRGGGWDV